MSCETCTSTPVHGKISLPASNTAYLTANPCGTTSDSVSLTPSVKVVTDYTGSKNYAYSCGCPDGLQDVMQVPSLSTSSVLSKYLPGWLLKLTGIAKGRLLVGSGEYLHYLKADNPGPIHYDGENVTVEHPQHTTHKGGDAAVVENGFLPLAYKDKEFTLEDGAVVENEVYRHGIQQVRDVGVGEMLGLTRDCFSGTLRYDVIQPEAYDLVKKGWKTGLKRLAYAEKDVTNGCGIQKVKEWFTVLGAVFGAGEIPEDKGSAGIDTSLVPVNNVDGELAYVLSRRQILERGALELAEQDDYLIEVVKVTRNSGGEIIGRTKQLIPIPDAFVT